ncbi:MAG: hypothetical protein FGM40_07895 [Rhodocyclaceae bacterium]|nr:hypothetical protein [Rhodocyclaceae bacterium]
MPDRASTSPNLYALIRSCYALHTLFTLSKAGVFDLLYSAAKPLDEVSVELGLDQAFLQSLINFAVAMNYIEKRGNGYRVAAKGRPFSRHSGTQARATLLG